MFKFEYYFLNFNWYGFDFSVDTFENDLYYGNRFIILSAAEHHFHFLSLNMTFSNSILTVSSSIFVLQVRCLHVGSQLCLSFNAVLWISVGVIWLPTAHFRFIFLTLSATERHRKNWGQRIRSINHIIIYKVQFNIRFDGLKL